MNNYILGAAIIVLLGLAFFNPPKAKADHIGWGITVVIPGSGYRNDGYTYDRCWQIQRNYEAAIDYGNWGAARYWERRWYEKDCNTRSYRPRYQDRGDHYWRHHRRDEWRDNRRDNNWREDRERDWRH